MKTLFGSRQGWVGISTVLMLAALITERLTHPLAATLFDVASDFFSLLGVLLLTFTPIALEVLIKRGKSEEAVRWGRALGGVALCFAWLLHLMMWPIYCIAWGGLVAGPLMTVASFSTRSGAKLDESLQFWLYGFLAYAPLVATIVLLCQQAFLKTLTDNLARSRRIYWLSLTAAAVVFLLRPAVMGYHIRQALSTKSDAQREKSLTLLRLFGAEYDLRVRAFRRPPTYPMFLAGGGIFTSEIFGSRWETPDEARKVYFLMTGTPFSKAPTPPAQKSLLDQNDQLQIEETGGERVGSTVNGLKLSLSEREVRYSPSTQTAQTHWTLAFENTTSESQEARATITLPEGAVVSDAWLWINGEQRPAAFGGKAQVRAAYQEVAVVQRRDPLLVTCTDPRRVLIQCFPVLPKKSMQIRLQLTQTALDGKLTPAQLTEVNFEQPKTTVERTKVNGKPWSGEALAVARLALPAGLLQKAAPTVGPSDVIVAVDTSASVGEKIEITKFIAALKTLPSGSRVKFVNTRIEKGEESGWTDAAQVTESFLRSQRFVGGVDAVPALKRLSQPTERPTTILWLHGPVPQEAVSPQPLLEARSLHQNTPSLVGLLVSPGQDVVMDALATDKRIHTLEGTDWPAAVQRAAQAQAPPAPNNGGANAPLGGREPALGGIYLAPNADADSQTDWARLAATSRVLRAWYTGYDQDALAKAAARRRLITPLSGAVVLESLEQYKRHGLDPNSGQPQSGAPDVATAIAPEPGTLAFVSLGGLIFLARRRRR
ncbi:VIT domain-containing protein [Armatimonas sp.]|uniref:VIT domain-containing protein n=1 Tax=Armatimonas sp. TaxID=1872638 RepID=UPI00286B8B41|nr:VIT domain-containing protein [Armatimonas sp.]